MPYFGTDWPNADPTMGSPPNFGKISPLLTAESAVQLFNLLRTSVE
jgi:hypothetical protein